MRILGHVSFLCFTLLVLSIFTSVSDAYKDKFRNKIVKLSLQHGNKELAQDIDKWLEKEKPAENTVYSPISIYNILTAVYLGTEKETKKELQEHFNFNSIFKHEDISTYYASQFKEIISSNTLDAFNSYVFHKKNLQSDYEKDLKILDFISQHFKTFTGKEHEINEQVKKDTDGMIKEMFSPGSFDDMTSLVLLNTILFKGNWDESRGVFHERDTRVKKIWYTGTKAKSKGPFKAEFMYSKKRSLKIYEDKDNKILYISLKFDGEVGKPVWMTIAMPLRASKVPVHQVGFNATVWNEMMNREVNLWMPKFEIKSDNSLIDFMNHLGASRLFNAETANLERMFGEGSKNYVAKFSQKAVIKVNEKGAEAAAATGLEFVSKSMPRRKKTIEIKRPFKFFIHSTKLDFVIKQTKEQQYADLFFAGIVNCPMNNCN